jgi:YidC/Oxa1 family membrane protein insertase
MDRRFLNAFTVGLLLMLGWYFVYIPWRYPPPPSRPPSNGDVKPPTPSVDGNGKVVGPTPPTPPVALPDVPAATVPASFGSLNLVWDNRGARLVSVHLPDSSIDLAPPPPSDQPPPFGLFVLRSADPTDNLEGRGWSSIPRSNGVAFETTVGSGLVVRKIFEPGRSPDQVHVRVELQNPTDAPRTFEGKIDALPGIEHDGDYRHEMYLRAMLAEGPLGRPPAPEVYYHRTEKERDQKIDKLARYRLGWADESLGATTKVKGEALSFAGLKNRYFTLLLWPGSDADRERCKDVFLESVQRPSRNRNGQPPQPRSNIAVRVDLHPISVAPGQTSAMEFHLYAGPLKADRLPAASVGDPDTIIDYRGFDVVGHALVWLISRLRNVNWGLGIIVATVVVRLALAPLSIKSQASMLRIGEIMKRIKPRLDELRERYKDDPRRMQRETMELMGREGYTPMTQMSGCWPVLVQLPIFIGMYSVMEVAVELRHQPFVLWVTDLSQPDRLVSFGRTFALRPFGWELFSIDAINVLPVLMFVTWMAQMYLTPSPPPTDPQQARVQNMMKWLMPSLFFLVCYGYASGLSLYFFINSLLGIIESKIVRKFFLKPST